MTSERDVRCNARNLAIVADNGTKGGIITTEDPCKPPPPFRTTKERMLKNVVVTSVKLVSLSN